MMPQNEVWEALRESQERVHALSDKGTPSANRLWQMFMVLKGRLYTHPPSGKDETLRRLRQIGDECVGAFAEFLSAVNTAFVLAKQRDDW